MLEEMKPHLVELRERVVKMVISVFIGFGVAFLFHNQILSWITKPLNEALIEVGKIVEARDSFMWKLKESNSTSSSLSVPSVPKAEIKDERLREIEHNITMSAERIEKSLEEVSKKLKESELSKLLMDASSSIKDMSSSIRGLILFISNENNLTKISKRELLKEKSYAGMITTHQVGGAFFIALKVSFFAGIVFAIPFILWQLWLFIAPGLHENEKEMVKPFVLGGSTMFVVGVLFAYYIVTPFGFQFLITFGSFLYTPLINIEDYVGFFTKIMVGFGIAFELPVLSYFLAKLGFVTDQTLKDFFKYAVVLIFILAALLTPPDVLTQLLMAGPLIVLYGISIYIVGLVNPHREED
jgi:sec-independent protein translocase protein TatC